MQERTTRTTMNFSPVRSDAILDPFILNLGELLNLIGCLYCLLALDRTWHQMSSPQKQAARTLGYTQDDFMQDAELEAGHDHDPVDAALRWNGLVGRLMRAGRSGSGGAASRLYTEAVSRVQNADYPYSVQTRSRSNSPYGSEESLAFEGDSQLALELFGDD